MSSKKLLFVSSFAVMLSLLVGVHAFADTTATATTSVNGNDSLTMAIKPHGAHAIMVTLNSVSGTTLTVTARGKDVAITTIDASHAKVFVKGVASDVSKLQAGDRLVVLGNLTGNSSLTATRISDGSAAFKSVAVVSGLVTAVGANSLTVSTSQHAFGVSKNSKTTTSVTINVDGKTNFNVPGNKSASLSDIAVGNRVLVIGVDPTTGSGTARLVSVMPARTSGKVK